MATIYQHFSCSFLTFSLASQRDKESMKDDQSNRSIWQCINTFIVRKVTGPILLELASESYGREVHR